MPRHAAEFRQWMDTVVDAVTACARDPDIAFAWITRVEAKDCTFDELGAPGASKVSLDAKLRAAITKQTVGSEAEKRPELVSALVAKREALKRGASPKQITGRE